MALITINGIQVKAKNGSTILQACESIGVKIPTLCFIEEINEIGFCRICVVEIEGEQDLVSACNTQIKAGMVINTESDTVLESRKSTLQLLASRHRFNCWICPKDGMCEFYDLLKTYDVVFEEFGPSVSRNTEQIFGSGISQDLTKCVLCKRCVAVCQNVVTANVLKFRDDDGMNPTVSPTVGLSFDETGCIFCGQCVKVCPTGTLFETSHVKRVETLLRDSSKYTVAQTDPAVLLAIGEEFGMKIGTLPSEVEGKLYNALRLLGFDDIADDNFGKDLNILEESSLLINRIKNGGTLPLFTSHCASSVRYIELFRPEYLENLSTTKSPHMMQGSLIKNYYAPKYLDKLPSDVAVISIMPCTSKKAEIDRPEMEKDGIRNVDAVLTVRELAKMIKRKGINFKNLEDINPSSPFAKFSDLGSTYNSSVGVLESVLQAVSETLEEKSLSQIKFNVIYGNENKDSFGTIQEASVTIGGNKLNVAVVHGGAAMKEMFKIIDSKKKDYHFIEFMACPGGCVTGGGMPIVIDLPMHEVIKRRTQSFYENLDTLLPLRKPFENPVVLKIYEEFLNEPNSKTAYEHCHTHFSQKAYKNE